MTRNDTLKLLGIIVLFAVVIAVGATALRSRSQTNSPGLVEVQVGNASPTPTPRPGSSSLLGTNINGTTVVQVTPVPTARPTQVITTDDPQNVTTTTTTVTTQTNGLTTTTSATPGQVVVTNEDGTMYLTTVTTEGGEAVPETEDAIYYNAAGVQAPEGFAKDFGQLLNSILTIVMVVSALLVFFFLIMGGIEWITSGGDKGKTDKARDKMTAAVIGLIIVAASFAILTLALNFLGFDNLNDVFRSARPLDGTLPPPTPTPLPTPTPTPTPAVR